MELPPNLPPPAYGLGYDQGNFQPAAPARPTSISAISITAIVIGSLFVLCGAFGALMAMLAVFMSSSASAMGNSLQYGSTGLKVFNLISSVVITGMHALLLAGGIGGVQARPWARQLLIKWSVVMLIWIPLSITVQSVLIALIPNDQVTHQLNRPGLPRAQINSGALKAIQIGSTLFGGALQCIFPPFILVLWRRPYVIEAFESGQPSFG